MKKIKLRFWLKRAQRMSDSPHWLVNVVANDPDVIAMLWTGLTDKNGTEIYEGDIARYHWDHAPDLDHEGWMSSGCSGTITGPVVMTASRGARIRNKYGNYSNLTASRSEVIGNIYENPDGAKPTETVKWNEEPPIGPTIEGDN